MRTADLGDGGVEKGLAILAVCGLVLTVGYGSLPDTASVQTITDLYLGLVLLSLVVWILVLRGTPERARWPELAAFTLAGVAMAYLGLSELSPVPSFQQVSVLGDIALWGGCLLLLYRIGFRPETA